MKFSVCKKRLISLKGLFLGFSAICDFFYQIHFLNQYFFQVSPIVVSSRVVSRSGGGGGGPTCFNIGYSEPTRAESREGSSTPWGSSVGVYPWLPTRVMLNSDWLRYGAE